MSTTTTPAGAYAVITVDPVDADRVARILDFHRIARGPVEIVADGVVISRETRPADTDPAAPLPDDQPLPGLPGQEVETVDLVAALRQSVNAATKRRAALRQSDNATAPPAVAALEFTMPAGYEHATLDQLKKAARRAGIPTGGSKVQLAHKLHARGIPAPA